MIKDFLISFRDNFQEKVTNPFLGTYVSIWCIRNWELLYSVINFDTNNSLDQKVLFIKTYFNTHPFVEGVLSNILWTFLVLIITYILLNSSRVIVNLSEKQLKPWIYKITDSKSIVLKSRHVRVKNERDELQVRLDKERDSKTKLETQIKNLEEEIEEIVRAQAERQGEESLTETEENALKEEQPNEVDLIVNKLTQLKIDSAYVSFCEGVNRDLFIKYIEHIPKFLALDLAITTTKSRSRSDNSAKYKLTGLGKSVLRKIELSD